MFFFFFQVPTTIGETSSIISTVAGERQVLHLTLCLLQNYGFPLLLSIAFYMMTLIFFDPLDFVLQPHILHATRTSYHYVLVTSFMSQRNIPMAGIVENLQEPVRQAFFLRHLWNHINNCLGEILKYMISSGHVVNFKFKHVCWNSYVCTEVIVMASLIFFCTE